MPFSTIVLLFNGDNYCTFRGLFWMDSRGRRPLETELVLPIPWAVPVVMPIAPAHMGTFTTPSAATPARIRFLGLFLSGFAQCSTHIHTNVIDLEFLKLVFYDADRT